MSHILIWLGARCIYAYNYGYHSGYHSAYECLPGRSIHAYMVTIVLVYIISARVGLSMPTWLP